jgi:hypothetical protein
MSSWIEKGTTVLFGCPFANRASHASGRPSVFLHSSSTVKDHKKANKTLIGQQVTGKQIKIRNMFTSLPNCPNGASLSARPRGMVSHRQMSSPLEGGFLWHEIQQPEEQEQSRRMQILDILDKVMEILDEVNFDEVYGKSKQEHDQ